MDIRKFLVEYLQFTDENLINTVLACADVKAYPRGQVLVYAGDPNLYIWFLMSGLVGGYNVFGNSEYCECLAGKVGTGMIDFFPPGATSRITIKTIEESTLMRVPITSVDTLMAFQDCKDLSFRLMTEYAFLHIQIQNIAALHNAEEKITQFAIAFPEFAGRLPDQELASILGMSERTLFRARRRLREGD